MKQNGTAILRNGSLHEPSVVMAWPDTMTRSQMWTLLILPLVSLALIWVYLWLTPVSKEYQHLCTGTRIKKEDEKKKSKFGNEKTSEQLVHTNRLTTTTEIVDPPRNVMSGNYTKSSSYETMHDEKNGRKLPTERHSYRFPSFNLSRSFIEEGEISGDYMHDWKFTFDFYFLWFMILLFLFLFSYTYMFCAQEFYSFDFWIVQWMKLGLMMSVSCIGGVICRYFSLIDEQGYILTNKNSKFKVNYTRKLQHFAAYIIPLLIKPHGETVTNFITVLWGDYFTLLNFLLLIKPVRESCTFFMLQFNSLDRPEDRPHTLKWIVAGNIIPGFNILLFFHWLFSPAYTSLLYIIIFITGIGDGLAEPVGVTWGKHKYKIKNWLSEKKYTRSLEGSTCVFMSGMIFPALQYYDFDSFRQVLISMIILAPTMAYAEATAPHTLDTPVLMIGCGTILYTIISLL